MERINNTRERVAQSVRTYNDLIMFFEYPCSYVTVFAALVSSVAPTDIIFLSYIYMRL